MKKAAKKPRGHSGTNLQELMPEIEAGIERTCILIRDALPDIFEHLKTGTPTPIPCTRPPGRWVFGKHMAVNLTQLLDQANSLELLWESAFRRGSEETRNPDPILLVHRGDRFENMRLEPGMVDSVVAVLQEFFPDWPVFWPELPSTPEPGSGRRNPGRARKPSISS